MAMSLMVFSANAQITTGESTSNVVRTGNRAQKGDFGIYFGATTDMFKNIGSSVDFSALPLINLKYMGTDKLEYRLGIEWWKKSETNEIEYEGKSNELTTSESSFMFYPGVAYHFNNRNLLDVYVGGELPFGFGGEGTDDGDTDASFSNFQIGLGAFIGLQAYIANLPLAIGVEYGISTQYKTVSDGSMSQDNMTISYQKDASYSKWVLGHQVRFTLSYYFNLSAKNCGMKFVIKSLSVIAVAMTLLTSCGTHTASTPYSTSALEIHMSDLQYLGESQISCEYNTYLGFIKSISKINGQDYVPGNDVTLSIPRGSGLLKFKNKGLNLASQKVLEDYPEATYFQIVMESKQTDVMFLGSTTLRKAKVRAYKFK